MVQQSSAMVKSIAKRMQGTPMPVLYTEACQALVKCQTINETKYFADKSDALAAWAKIYKDERVMLEAKRLKLRAYRRMNEIAEELRPRAGGVKGRKNGGTMPGPASLLQEHGFTRSVANQMRKIGKLKPHKFEAIVNAARVPSPGQVYARERSGSEHYINWTLIGGPKFRAYCRKFDAKDIARGMLPEESVKCRQTVKEIRAWLEEFESYLK